MESNLIINNLDELPAKLKALIEADYKWSDSCLWFLSNYVPAGKTPDPLLKYWSFGTDSGKVSYMVNYMTDKSGKKYQNLTGTYSHTARNIILQPTNFNGLVSALSEWLKVKYPSKFT